MSEEPQAAEVSSEEQVEQDFDALLAEAVRPDERRDPGEPARDVLLEPLQLHPLDLDGAAGEPLPCRD